jgi:hypothetical protein
LRDEGGDLGAEGWLEVYAKEAGVASVSEEEECRSGWVLYEGGRLVEVGFRCKVLVFAGRCSGGARVCVGCVGADDLGARIEGG